MKEVIFCGICGCVVGQCDGSGFGYISEEALNAGIIGAVLKRTKGNKGGA